MNPPLLTLVVPLHNREHLLEPCLQSILAQQYAPLEVILVDNASTDGTGQRAALWIAQHAAEAQAKQCVFRLLDESRQGADYARRTGLEAARGEWVAFFDDDDLFSPDFFPCMMAALRQQPAARWVLCRTRMLMPDGSERVRHGVPQPTLSQHLLASLVSTQSFVAQRDLLLEIGAWQPHLPLWNDYYLGALLLLRAPQPAWCEGVFHRIVQHAESLTGQRLSPKWEEAARTLVALHALLVRAEQEGWLAPSVLRLARRALFLRAHLTAGRLRHEGEKTLARAFLNACRGSVLSASPSLLLRCGAHILSTYTAWGGRGAWRLALELCKV